MDEPKTCACKWCGKSTNSMATQECDSCWELRRQVEANTAMADRMLKVQKTAPRVFPESLHPDTKALVHDFAKALEDKLRLSEIRHGYTNQWKADDWMPKCRRDLQEHILKGDPLDVAAYCAFLWFHGEKTS